MRERHAFQCSGIQFGAGQTVIGVRFNMRAIIFADQERVAMDGNDLAVLFYAGMPSEIKRTGVHIGRTTSNCSIGNLDGNRSR